MTQELLIVFSLYKNNEEFPDSSVKLIPVIHKSVETASIVAPEKISLRRLRTIFVSETPTRFSLCYLHACLVLANKHQ